MFVKLVIKNKSFLFRVGDDNIAAGCNKTRAAVRKYNVAIGGHVAAAGHIGESRGAVVHFFT
jgi:hypothetical protein